MRRGILSDEAIKRMFPEHFPPDFRTHQLIYEDGVDVPKHRLTGIKRSKTAHQHLKTKPRYPLHDLFLHSQAVAPLNPGVKSSVGAYRRAIGDALEREGASFPSAHPSAAFQVSNAPVRPLAALKAQSQRDYAKIMLDFRKSGDAEPRSTQGCCLARGCVFAP